MNIRGRNVDGRTPVIASVLVLVGSLIVAAVYFVKHDVEGAVRDVGRTVQEMSGFDFDMRAAPPNSVVLFGDEIVADLERIGTPKASASQTGIVYIADWRSPERANHLPQDRELSGEVRHEPDGAIRIVIESDGSQRHPSARGSVYIGSPPTIIRLY